MMDRAARLKEPAQRERMSVDPQVDAARSEPDGASFFSLQNARPGDRILAARSAQLPMIPVAAKVFQVRFGTNANLGTPRASAMACFRYVIATSGLRQCHRLGLARALLHNSVRCSNRRDDRLYRAGNEMRPQTMLIKRLKRILAQSACGARRGCWVRHFPLPASDRARSSPTALPNLPSFKSAGIRADLV